MRYWRYPFFVLIALSIASPAIADEEDLHTQMMRATVKISHSSSTATGFILTAQDGKFMLITAAHVLESTHADETEVIFRSKDAEGHYRKAPVKLIIRKNGKTLWTQHPAEDVAAIWIVPPKDADLAKIPPDLLASDQSLKKYKVHPGESLSCLGYPHRVEANDAGFPLLRSGALASFPILPTATTKTFTFSANTFEGDSGGPVYLVRPSSADPDKEVRLIMGLVIAQRFLDEEAKMIYGTTKIRHRLGLAVIVHASFIRETIDRLP
jgi:V8-like Glu-specific endopeptidase